MGFFKKIGQSLKGVSKMISIKNITKVATGQPVNFGQELAGRVLKPFMPSQNVEQAQQSETVNFANDYINMQAKNASDNLVNSLVKKKPVQDAASNMTAFFSKVYFQTMWTKYKNLIIGLIVILVALVIWRSRKPKNQRARR